LEQRVTRRGFNPALLQQTSLTEEETKPKFLHPFTDEQVEEIKAKYKELARNNFQGITLEDQKKVIIPHLVIHRTEVFNLKSVKEQEKEKAKADRPVRTRKEKEVKDETLPREKKLTKKQYQDKLMGIIMGMATGQIISDEDKLFYDNHQASEGSI